MSMLIWKKKNNAKHLILFIHGLKGGSDTWAVDKITSFPQLICEDEDFCDFSIEELSEIIEFALSDNQ